MGSTSAYMSHDLLAAWRAGSPDPIRWIAKSNYGIPDWAREGEVPTTEIPFRTTDAEAQIVAVRQGLGMTTLPCFVGDSDPLLVRVPEGTCCPGRIRVGVAQTWFMPPSTASSIPVM